MCRVAKIGWTSEWNCGESLQSKKIDLVYEIIRDSREKDERDCRVWGKCLDNIVLPEREWDRSRNNGYEIEWIYWGNKWKYYLADSRLSHL